VHKSESSGQPVWGAATSAAFLGTATGGAVALPVVGPCANHHHHSGNAGPPTAATTAAAAYPLLRAGPPSGGAGATLVHATPPGAPPRLLPCAEGSSGGLRLGDYELGKQLGVGAFGKVRPPPPKKVI
jgi:hypothetical protein